MMLLLIKMYTLKHFFGEKNKKFLMIYFSQHFNAKNRVCLKRSIIDLLWINQGL